MMKSSSKTSPISTVLISTCLVIIILCKANCNCQSATENAPASPQTDRSQQTTPAAPLVKLTVYHESLCPDSRRFFLNQLVPAYKRLGPLIKLQLIPFGHARTVRPNRVICQHGPRECDGNRLQACVQQYSQDNVTRIVDTIECLFRNEESSKNCIEKQVEDPSEGANLFDKIDKCRQSSESFRMMELNEIETGRVDYVPLIKLNDKFSEDIQSYCEEDLLLCICYLGFESETRPAACPILPQNNQKASSPSLSSAAERNEKSGSAIDNDDDDENFS